MGSKNGYVRKRVLIDKDFQFQYLVTWMGMAMALLAGLVLATVSMVFIFKIRGFNYLVVGNGLCAILITVLSMRYMIRFSHRIAGPAYRLERVIREVADGTYEGYITLRRRDYLKHIAESVNYLIERFDERQIEVRELHRQAVEMEQVLAADPGNPAELRELARGMVEKLQAMTCASPSESSGGETETPYLAKEAQAVEVGL